MPQKSSLGQDFEVLSNIRFEKVVLTLSRVARTHNSKPNATIKANFFLVHLFLAKVYVFVTTYVLLDLVFQNFKLVANLISYSNFLFDYSSFLMTIRLGTDRNCYVTS